MSNHAVERYSLANVFELPGFIVTKQVERVGDLCQALRQTPTLGTLVGVPGVGKSWAVQHVAQTEPEPDDHRASPVIYTRYSVASGVRGLLINLLNCLGPDYRAPVGDMSRLVCCWIHRRMTELIIIDDADRLNREAWLLLSEIHDRTRCAMLFVGQPSLAHHLRGKQYRQIHNRLSLGMELHTLTYDELRRFIQLWQQQCVTPASAIVRRSFYLTGLDAEAVAVKEIYRVTLGNLRRITQFVEQVERVIQLNAHAHVQVETIHAVAALMETGHF